MAKLIFILHRRADQTPEQCYDQWSGQQHTSIVKSAPGRRRWVQNRRHHETERIRLRRGRRTLV
jgi:hypothetical protein